MDKNWHRNNDEKRIHWGKPTPVVMTNRCFPWDSLAEKRTETWSLNLLDSVDPKLSFNIHVCILGCFPKIVGFPPQNHPWINRVFHYFHHPFWGENSPIFGNIDMFALEMPNSWSNWKFPSVRAWGSPSCPTRLKTANVLGSLFANTKPTCLAGNIQCQLECLILGSFDLVRHTVWFCF